MLEFDPQLVAAQYSIAPDGLWKLEQFSRLSIETILAIVDSYKLTGAVGTYRVYRPR